MRLERELGGAGAYTGREAPSLTSVLPALDCMGHRNALTDVGNTYRIPRYSRYFGHVCAIVLGVLGPSTTPPTSAYARGCPAAECV